MANTNNPDMKDASCSKLELEQAELSRNALLGHLADFEDHELGVLKSFAKHPWPSAWCIYAAWTIVLLSFDVQAAGAVVGIPRFRRDFGYEYEGGYVLPAAWQSGFNGAPIASSILAALVSGDLADRFGRKKVLAGALLISYVAISIEFIATSNPVFFAGKFLNGFMVGTVGTIMVGYIGEISPLALRGFFTCCVGLGYGIGPLCAFIIINYTGDLDSRWAYRAVFCAQFGFTFVATVLLPFMPESPWWLASKKRNDAALKSLKKLGYTKEKSQGVLALISLTLEEVRKETEGVTYFECLRKSNLRRTVISIAPLTIQALSGITFVAGYFTYYLQLAGYDTQTSYRLQIAQPVLSIVGNLMAASIIERVGRRNLTFWGLLILTIFLLITGSLGTGTTQPMIKGTVAFILIYSWWFNVSIGSTGFALLSEASTARLRIKTVAIGFAVQNSVHGMWQFVIPYMFNPDRANLGAKIAFIFGGLCCVSLVYLWFCQPETGGRSFQELDEMFAEGVPARHFKSYVTRAQRENDEAGETMRASL